MKVVLWSHGRVCLSDLCRHSWSNWLPKYSRMRQVRKAHGWYIRRRWKIRILSALSTARETFWTPSQERRFLKIQWTLCRNRCYMIPLWCKTISRRWVGKNKLEFFHDRLFSFLRLRVGDPSSITKEELLQFLAENFGNSSDVFAEWIPDDWVEKWEHMKWCSN